MTRHLRPLLALVCMLASALAAWGMGELSTLGGTLGLGLLTALLAVPAGLLAGLGLFDLGERAAVARGTLRLLAGVPPLVWGLVGLVLGYDALERAPMLTAGLVFGVMSWPMVVIAVEDQLSQVPPTQQEAALALGATRWEVLTACTLPQALPALWGPLLRITLIAMGEATPLLVLLRGDDRWMGLADRAMDSLNAPVALAALLPLLLLLLAWAALSPPQPSERA